jgi:hypothetical protein
VLSSSLCALDTGSAAHSFFFRPVLPALPTTQHPLHTSFRYLFLTKKIFEFFSRAQRKKKVRNVFRLFSPLHLTISSSAHDPRPKNTKQSKQSVRSNMDSW